MAKRSNNQKSNVKRKAPGVLAAAAQDVELMVEQAEEVAKKTVRRAATELGKLGAVRAGPAIAAELPEDKRFETRKQAAKPRLRKKLD